MNLVYYGLIGGIVLVECLFLCDIKVCLKWVFLGGNFLDLGFYQVGRDRKLCGIFMVLMILKLRMYIFLDCVKCFFCLCYYDIVRNLICKYLELKMLIIICKSFINDLIIVKKFICDCFK